MDKQNALRKLAEFAILCNLTNDIYRIMDTACRTVAETIGTDLAKVLRKAGAEDHLYLVSIFGYEQNDFSDEPRKFKESSAAGYAVESGTDVVSENVEKEKRFSLSALEKKYDISSMANILIPGKPGDEAWGVLEVDCSEPRKFTDDELAYLKSFAELLGTVIARIRLEHQLQETLSYREGLLAEANDWLGRTNESIKKLIK
ncbi:GAF domain-containing protein [Flavilitoribacter nigricans]|uniref:GAF domain-containing protein n=1 Tax=Flavilitoribacter nigricans (strain ATCC 23147 / DSM 23189 / NBRC 102662 / NCIMB 1420 / SS-2) TaxID=1122177 RepID=A0A2D0N1U6_FLAN2|nr:GAF domain-containing protein [Flavilitoribacter nigricans]PHN02358.1 hypothetical protein CRP01_32455 [Flavilitoribacter nigricans DSM 23189 = NBRC 102662]